MENLVSHYVTFDKQYLEFFTALWLAFKSDPPSEQQSVALLTL